MNANNNPERKEFTHGIIKDSLLKLLEKKNYLTITVSDICRCAGISRGTFYAHFGHIANVIDELFDDALKDIGNMALIVECPPEGNKECGLALCWFLRKNKKYQPLFFSDPLNMTAIQRTVDSLEERFISKMREKTRMPDHLLRELLLFQITGCVLVCRKNIHESDERWRSIQQSVDDFLKNGFMIT